MATHLVTGVAGQDGVLVARRLIGRGDRVVGVTGPGGAGQMAVYLDGVEPVALDVRDRDGMAELISSVRPDVVHNFAALSSVGRSWEERELTASVNHDAVVGILEALRDLSGRGQAVPRFLQASSSEIFGAAGDVALNEASPIAPVSPYGESKAAAHLAVQAARADGLDASNVILFSHTSVLHASHFALPSVARQAAEVALGHRDVIEVHDASVRRDWGSAHDVVEAWLRVTDHPEPIDVVVGTGRVHQLSEVIDWALEAAGVDAETERAGAVRPHDITGARSDIRAAQAILGWEPTTPLEVEIARMVAVETVRTRTRVAQHVNYLRPGRSPQVSGK